MKRFAASALVSITIALLVACDANVPSPDPTRSSSPTAAPTRFVLQSPFGTLRPPSTEPPPTPQPTPPPPNAQYWTRVADMAEPRYRHAAALLHDGRVMVIGGQSIVRDPDGTGRDHIALASTELFDLATGSWSPGPALRDARDDHTAITLPDGRVLVGGGGSTSSVESYDPASNHWASVAELPARHLWETATLLLDGRVLVVGRTDRDYPFDAAASIFDPATASWQATPRTDLLRGGHGALLLGDGTVLVVGGSPPGVHVPEAQPDAAIYNPQTDRWRDVGPMPAAAFAPYVALLGDGRALVMRSGVEGSATAALFDPVARTWATAQPWGERHPEVAIALADGRALVLDDYPGLIHAFDPPTGTWQDLGPFKELTNVPFTLLADGRVLVAGGYLGCPGHNPCARGEIAESWLFDPTGGP